MKHFDKNLTHLVKYLIKKILSSNSCQFINLPDWSGTSVILGLFFLAGGCAEAGSLVADLLPTNSVDFTS